MSFYQEVHDEYDSQKHPSGYLWRRSGSLYGYTSYGNRRLEGREEVGCLLVSGSRTELVMSTRETTSPPTAHLSDRKPGPAWRTIGGTIRHIKGDVYTVEDYEGNQVQLYTSRETKQLRGSKKVGDRVRAEITHSGFVNSIQ